MYICTYIQQCVFSYFTIQPFINIYHQDNIINAWLVVWSIFGIFPHIKGISSSQLTFLFFRGVAQPPTSIAKLVYKSYNRLFIGDISIVDGLINPFITGVLCKTKPICWSLGHLLGSFRPCARPSMPPEGLEGAVKKWRRENGGPWKYANVMGKPRLIILSLKNTSK